MKTSNLFTSFVINKVPHLTNLLNAIQTTCKVIQKDVSNASIYELNGIIDENNQNTSGDVQKKLDVISNDIMINNLIESKSCSILISEENEHPILVDIDYRGRYIVMFDPLDGSSNIDCNCCIGTIFSIFDIDGLNNDLDKIDIYDKNTYIKNGNDMICAGYVLYGPSTEMVITFGVGSGVHKFTLDSSIGEFVFTGNIKFPENGKKIYSINESNCKNWSDITKEYINQYKVKDTKYTQRYIGSMVADVHRTLLYGGLFMYPSDSKNEKGKLRILYECFPMARIVEEAGGKAITGEINSMRILDLIPTNIHEKTPIMLGSNYEIDKFEDLLIKYRK